MDKIRLDIVALSHSVTASHNYAVVLGEVGGSRRLPVVIGAFEAQAIAVAMERMAPTRPLTHDLFKNTLDTFDIEVQEVIITDLLDGIFYARLICLKDGIPVEVDSRTSDAIAMAVRYGCPIYCYAFILEQAGVILDVDDEQEDATPEQKETGLSEMTMDELKDQLEKVLSEEDYEQAAKIRDEMNRRS